MDNSSRIEELEAEKREVIQFYYNVPNFTLFDYYLCVREVNEIDSELQKIRKEEEG